MWAAGAGEKDAAVAATGTPPCAFVRAAPAWCAGRPSCRRPRGAGRPGAPHSTLLHVRVGSCPRAGAVSPEPRGHRGHRSRWRGSTLVRKVGCALCAAGTVGSPRCTTRFRSGELGLPPRLPGAFPAPLSLAGGVRSPDARQGWGRVRPALGRGRFHSARLCLYRLLGGFRSPGSNHPSVSI